jgi:hypothetical protein
MQSLYTLWTPLWFAFYWWVVAGWLNLISRYIRTSLDNTISITGSSNFPKRSAWSRDIDYLMWLLSLGWLYVRVYVATLDILNPYYDTKQDVVSTKPISSDKYSPSAAIYSRTRIHRICHTDEICINLTLSAGLFITRHKKKEVESENDWRKSALFKPPQQNASWGIVPTSVSRVWQYSPILSHRNSFLRLAWTKIFPGVFDDLFPDVLDVWRYKNWQTVKQDPARIATNNTTGWDEDVFSPNSPHVQLPVAGTCYSFWEMVITIGGIILGPSEGDNNAQLTQAVRSLGYPTTLHCFPHFRGTRHVSRDAIDPGLMLMAVLTGRLGCPYTWFVLVREGTALLIPVCCRIRSSLLGFKASRLGLYVRGGNGIKRAVGILVIVVPAIKDREIDPD